MHLKNEIINRLKLESCNLTHGAVKLLVFLAKSCDDTGFVAGVSYREFCSVTGMCIQSFYNAKKKLCDLKFIECSKKHEKDIDFRIINNSVLSSTERKEGYVTFDLKIFHDKNIWNLTDNAIILALEFLKNSGANKSVKSGKSGSFRKNHKDFIEEFSASFNVTKVQLRSYINSLKKFFSIGVRHGIFYATPFKKITGKHRTTTVTSVDKAIAFRTSDVILRRFGLRFVKHRTKALKLKKDLVELLMQYKNYANAIWGIGKPTNEGEVKSLVQYGAITTVMQQAVTMTFNVLAENTSTEEKEDFLAKNIKFLHKNIRKVLKQA